MTHGFFERSGLGEAILGCDLGCDLSLIKPTTKATDDVKNQIDEIIPENFSETDSPYNQPLTWSDNCVTGRDSTVFIENGQWDMISCPDC